MLLDKAISNRFFAAEIRIDTMRWGLEFAAIAMFRVPALIVSITVLCIQFNSTFRYLR